MNVQESMALALEVQESQIVGAVFANGALSSRIETEIAPDQGDIVPTLSVVLGELMKKAHSDCSSLGVAVSGWFDPVSGIWKASHPQRRWQNLDIKDRISKLFGGDLHLVRLGEAVALAEKKFGRAIGLNDYFSLYLGWDDVFGGQVADAQLDPIIRGPFGHTPVSVGSDDTCACAMRGTLSAMFSVASLLRKYDPSVTDWTSARNMLHAFIRDVGANSDSASSVVKLSAAQLLHAIAGLVSGESYLSHFQIPPTIIVGGVSEQLVQLLVREACEFHKSALPFALETGHLGLDAPLVGAGVATTDATGGLSGRYAIS